jgi:hypothetical protein
MFKVLATDVRGLGTVVVLMGVMGLFGGRFYVEVRVRVGM